jgi:release factor glutamine methyltransferase
MNRLIDILTKSETYFRGRGIPSPRLEAELILSHVLSIPRIQLYLDHDRPLGTTEIDTIRALVSRRGKREPLSWILGSRGFHNITLQTAPNVLDPRPDTETLVEAALEQIPNDDALRFVADVGCGTGAVGLAIAMARPNVRLYCVDLSDEAIELTRQNVEALDLSKRVAVLKGNLLEPIPKERPIDWVVSNPPYIPTKDIDTLEPEVARWEPRLALDGGPDGLTTYRKLIPRAAERVRRGLLLEVGHDQAGRVTDLLRRSGFTNIDSWKDLAGRHRVIGGTVNVEIEDQTTLKL